MKRIYLFVILMTIVSWNYAQKSIVIGKGQMPYLAKDKHNNVHVVYGTGDSIMYTYSKSGGAFSRPSLVAVLPGLFASATRGPQIAAADDGLIVTAAIQKGDIFCYKQNAAGKWAKVKRLNDNAESAKEMLMALSADGMNAFAAWLGVKSPRGQNVYGTYSSDGGKTWSKNLIVYASPDSTVCECCKPSVAVKGNNVYVMFRNWLGGSRDLYVAQSANAGKSFEKTRKLGLGTWKLNGCPMDGGGVAVDNNGTVETVWRREGKIFASALGMPEKEIGEGRGCSIETVNGANIYAWSQNGDVIVLTQNGTRKNLGKGILPLVKAVDDKHAICVWENDNHIHAELVAL
jgi:hypothetical protein